jgi:hypothetical protein
MAVIERRRNRKANLFRTGSIYGLSVAAFTPAALFANGEGGAWYDPSDLSTMFQNSDGTVAVTADGDPVGYIADKSGNGFHATQATAAARPTYKTSGGLHWLLFDGVDDYLLPPSGMTAGWTVAHAMTGQMQTTGGQGAVIARWGTVNFQDHEPFVSELYSSFGKTTRNKFGALFTNTKYVVEYEAGASDLTARLNGAQSGSVFTSTSGWRTQPLIGGGLSSQAYFQGEVYSLLVINRVLATSEAAEARTYIADKTGVTL